MCFDIDYLKYRYTRTILPFLKNDTWLAGTDWLTWIGWNGLDVVRSIIMERS